MSLSDSELAGLTPRQIVESEASEKRGRRIAVGGLILDILQDHGIDTIFGIPGGAVSSLYAGLVERPQIRVVNAKHETGAIFLAMGYAMATGRPGAVITTAGPGITNALTGLASAYYDRIPLLMLSGEVPTTAFGRGALQEGSTNEFDALSMVRNITRFAAQVTRPETAAALTHEALRHSIDDLSGPTFLSLPLNVSSSVVAAGALFSGSKSIEYEIDGAACHRAVNLLLNAKRPLIIAGSGGRRDTEALIDLVDLTGAPILVTPKAKGIFPEDHSSYLGILGFGGHESAIAYLSGGVDVILVCGSGLNDFSTNGWSSLVAATKVLIQIDIDAARLGRNYPVDLAFNAPIDAILDRMLSESDGRPAKRTLTFSGVATLPAQKSAKGMLTTIDVALAMNEMCPSDAVFTSDMGEHLSVALHYLKICRRKRFVANLGFGSMGSGICTAIGFQMGAGSRRVYALCGDGGFLMYGSELATAVQMELPVTILVVNDSRLNMCHLGMHDLFGASTDMTTQLVDFAAIARAMGAEGLVVQTKDELLAALAARPAKPVVLDIRIDPDVRLDGSQRNAALRQFRADPGPAN
ncbi:thiamine pyrophosphate-binding protein [Methylocapsa sp. S129]|uniref:thiamine pyrophosphate-binding protein n=1 Tax=Methylocapsa sp. S129 TaxID=1641869 RepID=UPI00131D520D|nr:thiamine pyrophosphate-binding protein [Methylocapsa sp. S129]